MKNSLIVILSLLLIASTASANNGYYRFPDIHNQTVVFTAEGDLWTSQLTDEYAKRLTTHPALETQARISNDGKLVAYVANYDGATEVYVIATHGGISKRVTFENSRVKVHGWTAKNEIIYSSNNRVGPTGNWTLHTVNPDSLISKSIPLADAVEGRLARDNKTVFFTQFGLQISTDNTRVYRGGAMGQLWRFNLDKDKEATLLTKAHLGSARQPMPTDIKGQKILYFVSDASGSDNIWSMSYSGEQVKQLTHFEDFPVRAASLNQGRIIFQLGADLKLLDLKSNQISSLKIQLNSDFPNMREKWVNRPLKYLTSARLASQQSKIVITARGRVAVAGTDKTRLIEIDTPVNSRTRKAILSHNGKSVYAFNDASGEMEIWQFAADGSKKAKQLTHKGHIFRWNMSLSPDGKLIAHDDKQGNLWLLNLKSGNNKKILENNSGLFPFGDIVWSSDSQLLALTRDRSVDERSRVQLFSVSDGKNILLTSDKYNSYSPSFSPDGQWLYFLSERNFKVTPRSPWGDRNTGPFLDRKSQIFAYALKKSAKFPFHLTDEKSQSEKQGKEKADKKSLTKKKTSKTKKSKRKKNAVDWQGLSSRLWQVPAPSGNYRSLSNNKKFLFVLDKISEPNAKVNLLSIEKGVDVKTETYATDIAQYQLAGDGKNLFLQKNGNDNSNLYIAKAGSKFPAKDKTSKINSKDWQLSIVPKQEWQQIFHDAWLMHRDSLFDPKMRGVNWKKVKAKYQPLLKRITDRHELNDVIAHMTGELSVLHSQVGGGDSPFDPARPKAASLGATYQQKGQSIIIKHRYRFDAELPLQASPLLQPGVNAKEGDIIQSIDGQSINSIAELNKALTNTVGKRISLQLKRQGKTIVTEAKPVSTRADFWLRYNDWITANQDKVTNKNAEIGYLHLYAMGANDMGQFAREFYANYAKQGLIIDVRRNRGGNIDSWVIEKLLRKAWMFWQTDGRSGYSNMQQAFRGHLVVLADQYTYSDGEAFTAAIKALKLAPVIGKQTTGAGVWLTGRNRQSDNGIARVAEFPQFAMDGRWIVEGHGVEPNIEVDNLPHETFNGKDAQLAAAIQYLENKMKQSPMKKMQGVLPKGITPAEDIDG